LLDFFGGTAGAVFRWASRVEIEEDLREFFGSQKHTAARPCPPAPGGPADGAGRGIGVGQVIGSHSFDGRNGLADNDF
jgi:hypothetical protein